MRALLLTFILSSLGVAEPLVMGSYSVPTPSRIAAVSADFRLAAISLGLQLLIIDIRTGSTLFTIPSGRSVQDNGLHRSAVAFTPDSSEVLVGCEDGSLEVFDIQTGTKAGGQVLSQNRLQTVDIVSNGPGQDSLLFVTSETSFSLWRYPSFQGLHAFLAVPPLPNTNYYDRFVAALHTDGTFAAIGDKGRAEIRLFDLTNGLEVSHTRGGAFAPLSGIPVRMVFPKGHITIAAWVFDRQGSEVEWLEIMRNSSSTSIHAVSHLDLESAPFFSISQDGNYAATGHGDFRCARLIKAGMPSSRTVWLDDISTPNGTSVSLNSDGSLGLTLNDGTLELWGLP